MNQIDGKLVEIEGSSASKTLENEQTMIQTGSRGNVGALSSCDLGFEGKDIPSLSVFNKKVASLNQEYTAMLASTLESQRVFYQESLGEMQSNAASLIEKKGNDILELEAAL